MSAMRNMAVYDVPPQAECRACGYAAPPVNRYDKRRCEAMSFIVVVCAVLMAHTT